MRVVAASGFKSPTPILGGLLPKMTTLQITLFEGLAEALSVTRFLTFVLAGRPFAAEGVTLAW